MQNIPPVNSSAKITGPPASKNISTQIKISVPRLDIFNSARNSIFFFPLVIFIFSCTSTKNSIYFQTLQKDTTLRNLAPKNFESKIQKNDVLGITVSGLSPDIAFYNAPQSAPGTTGGAVNGYSVDENGNIQFVKLGSLHVEGLSKKELKELIEKDLIPYLKDVFVTVTFLNRHVTMLGGVTPVVLPMPGDNMTILDALAASGDIGEKGRIDNILIVRERDEDKEFKRLNLTNNSIFYSPYFYLQPNDVVYIEPAKIKANNTAQIISYVSTGITLLIFILNQLLK